MNSISGYIQVWTYDYSQDWVQHGLDIPVTVANGDQFGARAKADGYIGMWFINANDAVLDDFGGGTVSAGTEMMSSQSSPFEMIQPPAKPTRTPTVPPPASGFVPQRGSFFQLISYHPQVKAFAPLQQSSAVTINYDYDPLYRLTEANYSNGDYYHYGYDEVGNRLTQETLLGGLPSTTAYLYDDANRLTSVNGVTYTWDDNGNLLSDGVNTYDYDSANRLKSVSGQSTVSSYHYSGLGDRLSQTVNGVTTNYTLDLNTGLTQVLDDGANAYIYGNGRIAQVNTTTEYFLGDALGSVRQLTDAQGDVTLAKSYDPYGTATQSFGGGESIYAYTGEQVDVSGLTYLRARYYSSGDGRFLSRDTWGGDYNSPLSFNRWMYVEGNPVNYADPTGHIPSCGFTGFFSNSSADYVDKYVELAKTDWMNTYTAAGVAVQCWAQSYDFKQRLENNDYSGLGPAKITNMEIHTPYGIAVDGADSYGLLCYIVYERLSLFKYVPCTICESRKYMDNVYGSGNYKQEDYHDQTEMKWAVEYMKRRIKLSVDACVKKGCTDTDIYIATSMAQMGTSFTKLNIEQIEELPSERRTEGVNINWIEYFDRPNNADDTSLQLSRFTNVTLLLIGKGWTIPNINWKKVTELSRIGN